MRTLTLRAEIIILRLNQHGEPRILRQYADQWDNIAFHDMDKIQKIVDLLDLRHSKNILDIGCGTGILLPFLKKNIPYDGKIIANNKGILKEIFEDEITKKKVRRYHIGLD